MMSVGGNTWPRAPGEPSGESGAPRFDRAIARDRPASPHFRPVLDVHEAPSDAQRSRSNMYYMETTAREFNQKSSQILAAAARGETVTVTKNGTPVARVVPINDTEVPPYPTDAMGDLDLPDLGLPDLTDDEIEDTLKGMGA